MTDSATPAGPERPSAGSRGADDDEARRALAEVLGAVQSVTVGELDSLAREIHDANVVASYGVGREGLMMRALTMRLFHAGVDAHYVGDMTCPAVGPGDLLIVSLGPGRLRSIEAIADVAASAGARVIGFTAEPQLVVPGLLHRTVAICAQTMASDSGSTAVLPMGSAFEGALLVLGDLITNRVRDLTGESLERMRSRHTNLE